jgi:hypothetical protein
MGIRRRRGDWPRCFGRGFALPGFSELLSLFVMPSLYLHYEQGWRSRGATRVGVAR